MCALTPPGSPRGEDSLRTAKDLNSVVASVEVDVENTGERDGVAVVQVWQPCFWNLFFVQSGPMSLYQQRLSLLILVYDLYKIKPWV